MKGISRIHVVLCVILSAVILPCFSAEQESPKKESKYLEAVREFADNVLKYGRDTYGPKHTPLFVDGLNVNTLEPVKWISPEGERWILSNLASQQNLFRTPDGLTKITGDPKYRQAAMDAIRYAFENLRSPNGLLYWGNTAAYDALYDRSCGNNRHVFKLYFPYYELMWQVDPKATEELIQSIWAAHILNWSIPDMDRSTSLDRLSVPKGWQQEYKGGPVFFEGGSSMMAIGCDLIYAAAMLSKLSSQKEPLTWAKRLAYRYIETRNVKVGISFGKYTLPGFLDNSEYPLVDDLRRRMVHERTFFPYCIEQMIDPKNLKQKQAFFTVSPRVPLTLVSCQWTCYFLAGELLGDEGREFTRWALEELTARGNVGYRKTDNVWIPMTLDGTILEGCVYKKDPKGRTFKPISAVPRAFWGYALAYRVTSRLTNDEFMWEMARNIARGNGLGDISAATAGSPKLQIPKDHFDPYTLLALLELYRKTEKNEFLQAARKVGDNILSLRYHNGFFLPSNKHVYAKLDAIEALTLLYLEAAMRSKILSVPQVWPGRPLFNYPYRDKGIIDDDTLIYTLTESSEPPRSLQEAAACGDIEELKGLIAQGIDINGGEGIELYTVLHRAVISGHKEVVALLLSKGAQVDATDSYPNATALGYASEKGYKEIAELLIANGADINAKREGYPAGDTPLHSAARAGHKDVVELLIAKGADVNAKNGPGQTSLDIAINRNRKDIVELLVEKGDILRSIHEAARFGALAKVRSLIEKGNDINEKDASGKTPLHYAVGNGHKDVAELLIAKGADVNIKNSRGQTPLDITVRQNRKDILELLIEKDNFPLHTAARHGWLEKLKGLIDKGADINAADTSGLRPLYYAARRNHKQVVELLLAKGAVISNIQEAAYVGDLEKVNAFIQEGINVNSTDLWDSTSLHFAAYGGHMNVVELLVSKGADVNAMGNNDWPPLCIAAGCNHIAVAEYLIANGADVNPDNYWTPLQEAPYSSSIEMVELLIAKGAYVNTGPWTALHGAVEKGRRDMAEVLLAKGADVNAKNDEGRTPLHLAAWSQPDMVELLIAKGADVNAEGNKGETALSLAKEKGHTEIVELLRKHGAKK